MELTKLKMLAEAAKKPVAPAKTAPKAPTKKAAPVKVAPIKTTPKKSAKVEEPVKKPKVSKLVFNKVEAEKAAKDIVGIRNVVDDALADLSDKLGRGGNLEKIMKASGATKLDSFKDESGQTVLQAILVKTSEFKNEIDHLLTQAELMIQQVALSESLIVEGKEYADSAEFTDEFYGMMQTVAKLKQIVKNPRWLNWLKTTDTNFATDVVEPGKQFIGAINDADSALRAIDEEFDKAN